LKRLLNALKNKEKRVVVGIETGNVPGYVGAAVVEISKNGNDTVLDLHGFRSHPLPEELLSTLELLGKGGEFDSEEIAGINFLVLHNLSGLYREVLDEVGLKMDGVHLIGLKGMEVGGEVFPQDPSALSEVTGCVVASRFSIGIEDEDGGLLPVKESLLQRMLDDMIDRFGLESDVREAVGVALLANESLFHERSEKCRPDGEAAGRKRSSLRAVKRTSTGEGKSPAFLCGEFFFPE
jgi:hypothetical protein